jgi:chorismate mutase/prephenate dehydrogenase
VDQSKKTHKRTPPKRGPRETLERYRDSIENLDARILRLISRRLKVAEAIGEAKRRHHIPLRNFEVEAQVRGRMEALARELGLGASTGREVAEFLIEKSLEVQALHAESAYFGGQLSVLVAGGMGGMGGWFARFLSSQGHDVRISDPAPGESPFPKVQDFRAACRDADLVIVAVPMSDCGRVLSQIASFSPAGVVAEVCSLKGHLLPLCRKLRARGLRLVSFHPMFGPDATMLSGKKILFCTEGGREDLAFVKRLFESTSAELLEVSTRKHDQLMSLILGLTHLANIGLGRALAKSGASFSELEAAEGVTFHKQVATTMEVVAENPRLYFEIQALNAAAEQAWSGFAGALKEVRSAIRKRDAQAFAGIMHSAHRYFEGES